MSNTASKDTSQSPRQEALDRVLESFPATFLPRLVGVEFLQNMLGDARSRVKDSHRAQMKALGQEASEGEDVGIRVAGDTHINISAAAQAEKPSMLKKLLPFAIAAAVGGGGVGLSPLVLQWWNNRGAAVEDSEYEIRFYDKDGNQIVVPRVPPELRQ